MSERIRDLVADGARVIGGLLFLLTMCLVMAANCWGIFRGDPGGDLVELVLVEPDSRNPQHVAVVNALAGACDATGAGDCLEDLVIARSDDLNAASFGEGRYVFWEGAAALPKPELDGIAAHEVAHDVLLHSRRAQDAAEFLAFIAEVVSVVGGASYEDEHVIRRWLEAATLPRYSRKHELEADSFAVILLSRMGYSNAVEPLADLLTELMGRYGDSGGGFLDSHPATSERLRRLNGVLPN